MGRGRVRERERDEMRCDEMGYDEGERREGESYAHAPDLIWKLRPSQVGDLKSDCPKASIQHHPHSLYKRDARSSCQPHSLSSMHLCRKHSFQKLL